MDTEGRMLAAHDACSEARRVLRALPQWTAYEAARKMAALRPESLWHAWQVVQAEQALEALPERQAYHAAMRASFMELARP